jgi:hypothetical protein
MAIFLLAIYFDKLEPAVSYQANPMEWIRLNRENVASVMYLLLGHEFATPSKVSKVYPVRSFWFVSRKIIVTVLSAAPYSVHSYVYKIQFEPLRKYQAYPVIQHSQETRELECSR